VRISRGSRFGTKPHLLMQRLLPVHVQLDIADTQTGYIADTLDGNFVVGCMSMFEPNRVASL